MIQWKIFWVSYYTTSTTSTNQDGVYGPQNIIFLPSRKHLHTLLLERLVHFYQCLPHSLFPLKCKYSRERQTTKFLRHVCKLTSQEGDRGTENKKTAEVGQGVYGVQRWGLGERERKG